MVIVPTTTNQEIESDEANTDPQSPLEQEKLLTMVDNTEDNIRETQMQRDSDMQIQVNWFLSNRLLLTGLLLTTFL